MALHCDLPVSKDVCRLILMIFEYTRDFPREYKYTLGQDLERCYFMVLMRLQSSGRRTSPPRFSASGLSSTLLRTQRDP